MKIDSYTATPANLNLADGLAFEAVNVMVGALTDAGRRVSDVRRFSFMDTDALFGFSLRVNGMPTTLLIPGLPVSALTEADSGVQVFVAGIAMSWLDAITALYHNA